VTYDVALDEPCADYCDVILGLPDVVEWSEAASREAEEVSELEVEF
jgi:glutathione S-transferase